MFRVPPHLLPLIVLTAVMLFFGFVLYFRRNTGVQKVVEETLGTDSPEVALRDFHAALYRLKMFRKKLDIDPETAESIDEVLSRFENVA